MVRKAASLVLIALGMAAFCIASGTPVRVAAAALGIFVVAAALGLSMTGLLIDEAEPLLLRLGFGALLGTVAWRFAFLFFAILFRPGWLVVAMTVLLLAAIAAIRFWLGRADERSIVATVSRPLSQPLALCTVLFFLCLFIAIAFWRIGHATQGGHAFVPYFNLDYLNHVATTAELARAIPPQNPFFAGVTLHYYWFYHLFPSGVALLSRGRALQSLNACLIPNVLIFVSLLLSWIRLFVPQRTPTLLAVAIALFAFSYIGLLVAFRAVFPNAAHFLDGVSLISHSWFRDCLYEPHSLYALSLFLGIEIMVRRTRPRREMVAGCILGILLASTMMTDAFIGVVVFAYVGLTNARGFLTDASWRRTLICAIVSGTAVGAICAVLGVFPLHGSGLILKLHPVVKILPVYLLADLGPLFLIGLVGITWMMLDGNASWKPLLTLLLLSLAIGLVMRVAVEPNIALRKSLKVAQLPLVVLLAYAIRAMTLNGWRKKLNLFVCLACGLGLATLASDLMHYLDLLRPDVPATTYVSADEWRFLEWIRDNTSPQAVLQTTNRDRIFGPFMDDLLIPAIGERRTVYGDDRLPVLFRVPDAVVNARKDQIEGMLETRDPGRLLKDAQSLGIDYLYVENPRSDDPVAILQRRGCLRSVYQSGKFALFETIKGAHWANPPSDAKLANEH